jgi:hypothetical protein
MQENPGNQLRDNSKSNDTIFTGSYFVSPLKVSRIIRISWLILPGQLLLFWKVIVNIMYNAANKLTVLIATSHFGQKDS